MKLYKFGFFMDALSTTAHFPIMLAMCLYAPFKWYFVQLYYDFQNNLFDSPTQRGGADE
jgi:hypothetical protein